jgi:predicted DNA-binding protein
MLKEENVTVKQKPKITTSICFESDVYEKLEKQCEKEDRTKSYIINKMYKEKG